MKTELHPIPEPASTTRFLPDRALPPYRYVPGLHPHPFRHQGGHLFTDGSAPAHEPWHAESDWQQDERFLFAADLFNLRFYWEAHEEWEAMWHCTEEGTPMRDLLQSLIQGAAAVLQHHMGRDRGAKQLLGRAQARMAPWVSEGHASIYGVRIEETFDRIELHINGADFPKLGLSSS